MANEEQGVLIVGGGVAALSTALSLRARGISARLFEQALQLRPSGGALVMWSNAMAVLKQLGLGERILAAGTAIERSVFRTTNGVPLIDIPVGRLSREAGAPSVVIPRRALLGILGDALGDAISFGHRFERFEAVDGGLIVDFSDGQRVVGNALIGADGLHSAVRRQLLGSAEPRKVDQTVWVGIAPRAYLELPPGAMIGFVGQALRFWATRVGPEATYWYAIAKDADSRGTPASPDRQRLQEIFSGWQRPVGDLIRDTPDPEIIRTEIVDRPPSDVWGQGPTTLVGDAAHPMTPDLGQGACQAIEGSAILAACVAEETTPRAAFRRYEAARMPRVTLISQASRRIAEVSMPDSPILAWLRDTALIVGARVDSFSMLRWILAAKPPPIER